MPFNPDMSLLDSSFLYEFLTDCDLPATIEIAEGYDSNDSVEQSWSQGEIVYLHAMKDVLQVLGQDRKGNHVCIPLNYPGKIFESIPNRCSDKYDTIEEVIRDFPKYVRSLTNIPQSGVKVGDALCLLETSPNAAGRIELKCRLAGTPRSITLPDDQVGHFETLEDVNPTTMRDIVDQHLLPTRVRVRGGTQVFHETNNNKTINFEGLFTIKEVVQQKVLIVSTLHEKVLRVFKLPIDLEIRVRKENLNIDPKLFTEICRLIDREVNIDSTIIRGDGEASWMFDIADIDFKGDVDASEADDTYESLVPPVPPRSPSKLSGSNSKQTRTNLSTPQSETRYAPAPKLKPSRKPVSAEVQKGDEKKVPPQVAKKPNVHKSHHPIPPLVIANKANTTTQNFESHIESKRSEATSNDNRPDVGERTRDVGHTQSVSPSKPKSTNAVIKPFVQKGSTKPVSPQLVKPKPNTFRQKSVEETPSSHSSGPDETEGDYEYISNIPSVLSQKAKPAGNPVSPVVSVKESVKATLLPHGKPTPNAIKQKLVEEELPRSQHSAQPLQNSSECKNKDSPTKVTSQNAESLSEPGLPAPRSDYERSHDNTKDNTGSVQDKGKELLKDISVSEVSEWLIKLGLSEYVDTFAEESIDGNFLLELNAELMEHLGISNPLHRKKLTMFIQKGWTPKK